MHEMILNESTGTPQELAEKFNIKVRQLHNLIEEFTLCGAVIKYSRNRATYFYLKPFDFFENLGYESLSRRENKKIMIELLKSHMEQKSDQTD